MFGKLVCHVDLSSWAVGYTDCNWLDAPSIPLSSLSKCFPTLSGAQTCCVKMSCSDITIAKGLDATGRFFLLSHAPVGTLRARSLSLIFRFWSQVLMQDLRTTLPRPCWRFKMPKRLLQRRHKLLQVQLRHGINRSYFGKAGWRVGSAMPCKSGFKTVASLSAASRWREFCEDGSGEMFGASQQLFGTLDIAACTLPGHGWDTDYLSPEVVPAAVFLLFDLFVFMLKVFGRKCSRHACLLFLSVVDEADKEPSR